MGLYKDFLVFTIGIIVIIKSADLFTSGAEGIARSLKIPRIIMGLTIVSFATTAPEFTVSVFSSYMKLGGMAIGNAVGSCLANICLVLGIASIIRPVQFQPRIIKQELSFLIIIGFILYLFMWDARLGFADGLCLVLLLVMFFWYIIAREMRSREKTQEKVKENLNLKKDSFKFILGGIGVVASAKYAIIPGGVNIARFFGLPEIVIGLSLVAIGTSLPELFVAVVACFKKMSGLAAGNVIGANILNILWVLGFASMVNPLTIDRQTRLISMPVMLFCTLLFLLFLRKNLRLTKSAGLVLLAIYAVYLVYLFKFAYS